MINWCEFDKYAAKAYCAIHKESNEKNLGDITKVDETKLKPFNMICGGSPCQDFSVAGKQVGSKWKCINCGEEYNPLAIHYSKRHMCPKCSSENLDKTRSSLLVEFLRVVRANMPKFGIYENVKNIVGKKFRDTTFKLFEEELHEYGYNTYWKILNAKDYGVPQNRERVYLIFIQKEIDNGKFIFPEPFDNGIRLKDVLECDVDEKFYITSDKVNRLLTSLNNNNALLYDCCQVKREDKAREYNDYAPKVSARDYKDPRLVNENVIKQIGNISANTGSWDNPQNGRIYSTSGVSPTLNTCGGGNTQPKILQFGIDKSYNKTQTIDVANCLTAKEDRGVSNRKTEGTAILETPDISYCIDANYWKGTTPEQYLEKHRRQLIFGGEVIKMGRINSSQDGVVVAEDGIAPTHTSGHGNTPKVLRVGNINPSGNEMNGNVYFNDVLSPTVTTNKGEGNKIVQPINSMPDRSCGALRSQYYKTSQTNYSRTGSMRATVVQNGISIRKLTPKECFRLMGFPDSAFDAAKDIGISNTQLYKQAGNSIVVDVLYYIYVELYKAIPGLFEDLRLTSLFSGIGAFETALDRFYESLNNGNFTYPQG